MERKRVSGKKRAILPSEDFTTLLTSKNGRSYQTFQVAKIFAQYQSPEEQFQNAKRIVDGYPTVNYRRFLDCITYPEAKA